LFERPTVIWTQPSRGGNRVAPDYRIVARECSKNRVGVAMADAFNNQAES
jgi:hypothetical protein